ncbi:MAG: hypothetical protein HY611_03095 [Elusimicrobia bacterium]|nr:hypothetical protein [Elusimicrobiota bacterium]
MRPVVLSITLLIFCGGSTGNAQAETTAQEGGAQFLEQRLEALENWKAEQERTPVGTFLGKQKLGLLLQIKAFHDETSGVNDAFKGRRAEMTLSGDILADKVSYGLKIDPFLTGNITKDGFIALSYVPYADVQFGQYKFPQSLEGRWSSGDLDFIERSVVTGTFGDKRDFGVQLGSTKIKLRDIRWEYGVGVFNGSGQNTAENNENKDFAGRLGVEWHGLWAGINGLSGRQPTGYRSRFGGELRYVLGPAKLQAEYLTGRTERTTASPARQHGYYVLANCVWKFLRPGLRWESWNPDRDTTGSRQDALTSGLDYLLTADRKNKLSINFTKRIESGPPVANDEWSLQAQVSF